MAEVYLAASFDRAKEMQVHRNELAEIGYNVCSRWIDSHDIVMPDLTLARAAAQEDVADILKCEIMIQFTDSPSTTGGRHVEFGLAFAFGKYIAIVGQRQNVFEASEGVSQFDTWVDLMHKLRWNYAASQKGRTQAPFSNCN